MRITRRPAVILHGSAWHTKTWAPERWRAIAELLDARSMPLLLPAGGPEELDTALGIVQDLDHAQVLPPLSLEELAGVLAVARVVIGVDSGLTHLADALARPGIFLMGPTDPVRTGPCGDSFTTIVSAHPAAPCYNRVCDLTPGGRCCMDAIAGSDVQRALEYTLAVS